MQGGVLAGDPLRLVDLVVAVVANDRVPITAVGPQLLRLAPEVVGDDRVRSSEDLLGGPVVLLQHHNRDVGERGLEVTDVPHVSSRSEEHTSELQSLMRIAYAVFCLK